MELKIFSTKKTEAGKRKLPSQFNEKVRPDIIHRAVLALQSNRRQRYGTDPEAGKRHSSKISKRRRDFKGSYGHGISRSPRKIMSRSGTRFNWVGALAPNTVGGRKAHPPKASKSWGRKINKKENRKAIRSAIAATVHKEIVAKRGHVLPEIYPFILADDFEQLSKTKELKSILEELGFGKELERAAIKKVRAGKGKSRGRKYRRRKSVLIVVSKECMLEKAAANIPGIDVVKANALNAELLAPGTVPGRITLFTESALSHMEKEKMFM